MSLLYPDYHFDRIYDITVDKIREMGVSSILLDVDNTLTLDKGTKPDERTLSWLDTMRNAGIKMMIISNGKHERLQKFAKTLGLDCRSMAMKPLPFVLRSATKQLSNNKKSVMLIGDQIFTDILGANLTGIKSTLLTPIQLETSLSFRIRRRLERGIRAKLKGERS